MVLEGERFGIGRTPTLNEIVLRHANVARRHCALWVDPQGRLVAEDLNSSNGFWINGERAHRQFVGPGDKLYVGDFTITIESSPERVEGSS